MSRYVYPPGTMRWTRHTGDGDVRGHRAPEGWSASAHMLEQHPITSKPLPNIQWWILEEREDE